MGYCSANKELIYSFKPNSEAVWKQKEFSEHVKINSYGLRDREILEYSNYFRRIIILGDSFTYGHGVNTDETYPDFLETFFLTKSNKKIDIINAGIHGYGTDQEYKFYKTKLYSLKHDMLILSLNYNDIDDNINMTLYNIDENILQPLDATKNWFFLTNIYLKSPSIIQKSKLFSFILTRLNNKDIFSQLPNLDRSKLREWSKKKILLEIEALKNMCEAKNIKLLIVSMPIKKPPEKPYDWLKLELESKNISFVNVAQNPIWNKKKSTLFYKDDSHLTIQGNLTLAWQVYQAIKTTVD